MRMSRLFSQTLREAPADVEVNSHKLLLRAGFIRQLVAGVYTYLPLARRSLTKIENIIRQEMNAIGGQEFTMPSIPHAELWKGIKGWDQMDMEMGSIQDRSGRDLVLAMTHEEVVADLVRKEIRSYRQLPQLPYHIQTKWRDDSRPRAGLIKAREFTMKNSYSLDANWEGLDQQYRAHYQAYSNIFNRCALPVKAILSDVGMMGGRMAHQFMYLTSVGEDTLHTCQTCGFSANQQVATFRKTLPVKQDSLPLERIATPECKTIEDLATFLNVPTSKTAKAVFLVADILEGEISQERFVFAMVRGDMEVNESKLANAIKAKFLRPATEDEIRAVGAVPGYASPVGLKNILTIVDDAIPMCPNLISGANEEGYHLRNVNYGRDYRADIVTDIAAAQDGDACPECGSSMKAIRGIEVGNILKLGTHYSDAMGCFYLDAKGDSHPVIMGSYGISSSQLLACVAEEHHDEFGLKWPISVAPYQVHLVVLAGKGSSQVLNTAEALYTELLNDGIEVLFDDRLESPGVKFNDADLIGNPIRVTVSERALQAGGVEYKRRDSVEKKILPLDHTLSSIKNDLLDLQSEIEKSVFAIDFEKISL